MEKIDLNNYEAYFLDYMEGTLSAEEKHDLFAFLKLHPELKAEMEEDFGMVELEADYLSFDERDALKFDESVLVLTPQTIDEIMIAAIEEQLTQAHQTQLNEYIKANNLEAQFAYYKATKLKADLSITYSESQLLKIEADTALFLTEETVEQLMIAAVEGQLTTAHKNELEAYIKANNLEKQFNYFKATRLNADTNLVFGDKEKLKSDYLLSLNSTVLSASTVETQMIAAVEGQLNTTEKEALTAYIKTNKLEKKWAYYNATVLTPDTSIVYANKQKLKVKTGIITMPFITRVAGIAAVGLILISFGMNYWTGGGTTIDNETGVSTTFATDVRDNKAMNLFKARLNSMDNDLEIDSDFNTTTPFNNSPKQQEINQVIQSINNNDIVEGIKNDTELQDVDTVTNPNQIDLKNPDDLNPVDIVEGGELEQLPFELPKENLPEEEEIYASVKKEEPYKLVTDAAENLVKRDIQFTREQDQETNKYVAYSFKLGRFEFERKKSK